MGDRDGASEQSEEVMTRSSMLFLLWVGKLTLKEERREREKLRVEVISRIIEMYIKVAIMMNS